MAKKYIFPEYRITGLSLSSPDKNIHVYFEDIFNEPLKSGIRVHIHGPDGVYADYIENILETGKATKVLGVTKIQVTPEQLKWLTDVREIYQMLFDNMLILTKKE